MFVAHYNGFRVEADSFQGAVAAIAAKAIVSRYGSWGQRIAGYEIHDTCYCVPGNTNIRSNTPESQGYDSYSKKAVVIKYNPMSVVEIIGFYNNPNPLSQGEEIRNSVIVAIEQH